MSALSIGDYAFISDCQSAALVSRDGFVGWYCTPRFDSPSVFARLLDGEGGHWLIRPVGESEAERNYLGETMVLRMEFRNSRGRVALTDALALGSGERGHEIGMRIPHALLRRVEGVEGEVGLALEFAPYPEYGLTLPRLMPTNGGVVARGGPVELHLVSERPLNIEGYEAAARFTVRSGEVAGFALVYRRASSGAENDPPDLDVEKELENTREGWRSWSELHRGYEGPYTEQVRRSALVLQALTYAPTGAVAVAATTSLPKILGGSANWDYRFAWLRDLSLTLWALWMAACPDEPQRFFEWVDRAMGGLSEQKNVQIMYGFEGERDLMEHSLNYLEGFRGSRPVRVGNDAWYQKQLDVLGEVIDAAHLLRDQIGDEFDDATARLTSSLVNRAAESWREPDSGMWEARDKERHYLTSKVWCWVALDRAVKLASRLGEHSNVQSWEEAREEVREAILERGWSEEVGSYTGAFGFDRLDASVLLMPLVDSLPADDPRMRSTIEAIERELAQDGLVHRWNGDENGFLLCTYWLVERLVRLGERERATELFEQTTACANDLGLLAEMADAKMSELIGNFPQAFSHVGLINAAWFLAGEREENM